MAISLPATPVYTPLALRTPISFLGRLFKTVAQEATAEPETPTLAKKILAAIGHTKITPLPPYPRSDDSDYYSGYAHPQEINPTGQLTETPRGPLEQFYAAELKRKLASWQPLPPPPYPTLPANQLPDLAFVTAAALRANSTEAAQLKWRIIAPKALAETDNEYRARTRPALDEFAKHLFLTTETTGTGKTICLPLSTIAAFTEQTPYRLRKELEAAGLTRTAHPTMRQEQPKQPVHQQTLETLIELPRAAQNPVPLTLPSAKQAALVTHTHASIDDYIAFYQTKGTVKANTKAEYLRNAKARGLTGTQLVEELYYLAHDKPEGTHPELYKTKWVFTQKELAEMSQLSLRDLRKHIEQVAYTRAQKTNATKQLQLTYLASLKEFDVKKTSSELGIGATTARKYWEQTRPPKAKASELPEQLIILPFYDERVPAPQKTPRLYAPTTSFQGSVQL